MPLVRLRERRLFTPCGLLCLYRVSAQREPPAQRRPAREEALGVPGAQRSVIVTEDLHETTGDSDTAVTIASDARHIPRSLHGRETAHRPHKQSTQRNVSGTTRTTDTARAICTQLVTVAPGGLPLSKTRFVSISQHLRTTGLTRRRLKGITSREMNPSDRPEARLRRWARPNGARLSIREVSGTALAAVLHGETLRHNAGG